MQYRTQGAVSFVEFEILLLVSNFSRWMIKLNSTNHSTSRNTIILRPTAITLKATKGLEQNQATYIKRLKKKRKKN
jgi:hypothetical protein